MDGLSLFKMASILNRDYAGAKLNKISVSDDQMVLQLYAGRKTNLTIRVGDGNPVVFLGDSEIQVKADPLKMLNGAVVKRIHTRSYDRLMLIELEKRRPSGKLVMYQIIAELVGRNANVFVLNDDHNIIFNVNNRNIDDDRPIGMGQAYQPFKLNKQWDLDDLGDATGFNDLVGFYPVTSSHAEALTIGQPFVEAAALIRSVLLQDDLFYLDEKGRLIPFAIPEAVKILGLSDLGVSQGNKDLFKSENRRKKLKQYFSKKLTKHKNLLKKLNKELEAATDHEKLYAEADLLKSNLHILMGQAGDTVIYQYGDDGVEEIPFHVDRSVDYEYKVTSLYKRANRLSRSVPKIQERLDEVIGYMNSVTDDLFFLEGASDADVGELYTDIFMAKHKVKKQKDKYRFNRYQFGEAEYFVGRNSVINHELVFDFARSSDMWFHAQKIPSGHLILRKDGEPTEAEIAFGAQVVAAYSKHANESLVPVDYVHKKHVKKPKNTPMGFVIYHHFKTILVKPFSKEELDELAVH